MEEERNVRNSVLSVCDLKVHGDIPSARVASQIVTVGTRLYLHGGADEKASYGDLHVMEIEKATWKELKAGGFAKPTPRYGHSLVLDEANSRLVLFGGLAQSEQEIVMDEALQDRFPPPSFMAPSTTSSAKLRPWSHQDTPSNDFFYLDTTAVVWSRPECNNEPPSPRSFHSSAVYKGTHLVFGGSLSANLAEKQHCNELWAYDMGNDTWSQKQQNGDIPSSRHGQCMVCMPVQQKLFLFGGAEDDGALFCLDLSSFEDLTGGGDESVTWSRVETHNTAPLSRSFHTMNCIGEKLFIFAGQTVSEVSDLYIFDASRKKWNRPLYEGAINIKAHCSTVLHDKLIVFGGARERSDPSKTGGKTDALGPEDSDKNMSAASQQAGLRISRKLFFLNVLEIKEGASEGDFKFKLVTVGDSGVGKSCLLTRFVQDMYSDFHVSTIGVDFKTVVTMIKGKLVKLQLWDTAGQERFSVVTGNYYRNADGFVLVFDATNRESFEHIDAWLKQIQEHHDCGPSTVKLLVGNKYDMRDQVQVPEEEGEALAEKIGAIFVNTSAKTASNVDNAFLSAATRLVELRRKAIAQPKSLQLGSGGNSSASGQGVSLSGSGSGGPKSGGKACGGCGGGGMGSGGSASTAASSSSDDKKGGK